MHAVAVLVGVLFVVVIMVMLGVPLFLLMWCAGGPDGGDAGVVFVLWPLTLLVTIMIVIVERVIKYGPQDSLMSTRPRPWLRIAFWFPGWVSTVWILWVFLPIELNILSLLAKACSMSTLADVLRGLRWKVHPWTIGAVFFTFFGTVMLGLLCIGIRDWWKSGPYVPHVRAPNRLPPSDD